MADDWECANCNEAYDSCRCWLPTSDQGVEILRHQINWLYDYCFGNTEIPPPNKDWNSLQTQIKEVSGSYWNPCLGLKTDELKLNPWNLTAAQWHNSWPEAFKGQVCADLENGPDPQAEQEANPDWPPIEWFK